MSGYRGDGYGAYGDHGDDDFRWGGGGRDGRGRSEEHGAEHGNLMGRAEERVRGFFDRDDEDRGGRDERRLADDPRAVRAAEDYRQRHGREGYEGSYARHDEPYRQYRERHLAELDNDYRDYCREHGHEFSSAFENWRTQRRQNPGVPAMGADPRDAGATAEVGAAGGAGGLGGAASLEGEGAGQRPEGATAKRRR